MLAMKRSGDSTTVLNQLRVSRVIRAGTVCSAIVRSLSGRTSKLVVVTTLFESMKVNVTVMVVLLGLKSEMYSWKRFPRLFLSR